MKGTYPYQPFAVLQEATDDRCFGTEVDILELLIIHFLPVCTAAYTECTDKKKNRYHSLAHIVRFAGF